MNPDTSPAQLADTLAIIERALASVAVQQDALGTLTRLSLEQVPGAEYAGVTHGRRGGRFSSTAETDDLVREVDKIQYELRSGPCVDAVVEGVFFRSDDLRTDPRWTTFGQRAHETTGVTSMLSFRLFLEDQSDMVAGLNLYSRSANAFGESSERAGLVLATAGALALGAALARSRANNLEIALHTRTEIGIAMGVLMSQLKVTREQAFDLLRVSSQANHRKLADLARDVADTGVLPELP